MVFIPTQNGVSAQINWAVRRNEQQELDEIRPLGRVSSFFILSSLLFIIYVLTNVVEHYIILVYNNGGFWSSR